MLVEEEYFDVLQNLESAIVTFFRVNPRLTDFDVDKVVNTLIQTYRGEAIGKSVKLPVGQLAADLFDGMKTVCEWRLGRLDLKNEKGNPILLPVSLSVDEMVICLKRIRKSIEVWNKESGRQGYLTYISQFIL